MASPAVFLGWGRTSPTAATLRRIHPDAVPGAIVDASRRGIIARGQGRSYGDAAQNAGGDVLQLEVDPDPVRLDRHRSLVQVQAGVRLDHLIRELLPKGYFVPVTPGTRYVTVGGAIAADVHGKNHHVDGSIGNHILSMTLVDGRGEIRTLTPAGTPKEFWATVGGMGLTGVILTAELRVRPVQSSLIAVQTRRIENLKALLEVLLNEDHTSTYSVAWIDLLATGRRMGRSVLTLGEHAASLDGSLPATARAVRLAESARIQAPAVPNGLVNIHSIRLFNELYYRRARDSKSLEHFSRFFYPLDGIGDWNKLYGQRGLIQYQFTVPDGAENVLEEAVRLISSCGAASFLAVLKRFGDGNPGLLSFPQRGWTLALDLPARPGLAPLLEDLDRLVIDGRGRTYLAKDSRTSPQTLEQMYPRLELFRDVRRAMDPDNVFVSDMARRLSL